jgi:hypothetical protein
MSELDDAVERMTAYMRRTTVLPPPEMNQANFDMGLILGTLSEVLASQCIPKHDHHVTPHRGCPLR